MVDSECTHYVRKCSFLAPCCNKVVSCRFCHDGLEDHTLERATVEEIVCRQCCLKQSLGTHCKGCSIKFGFYSCLECRLFDDTDKQQFHCDKCGFCRTGGRENFFHCDNCNICLSKTIISSHSCRAESGKDRCPVCFEDVHTSTKQVYVPPCGHLIHFECQSMITKHGFRKCPLCYADFNNNNTVTAT